MWSKACGEVWVAPTVSIHIINYATNYRKQTHMNSDIRHSYLFDLCKEACTTGEPSDELETAFTAEIEELNSKHELEVEQLKQKLAENNAHIPIIRANPMVDNMVEALWATAHSRKDNAGLCELLRFDYLPETCLRQARQIKHEAVRCAYLNRRDTVNRKELLETETRSKVYASICDLAESDVDVLDAIAARLVAKPTKILANAVLGSSASQTKTLILAIDFLGKDLGKDLGDSDAVGSILNTLSDGTAKALRRSAEDFRLLIKCLIANNNTSALGNYTMDKVNKADYALYAPLLLEWFEFDAARVVQKAGPGIHRSFWDNYRSLHTVIELLTKVLDPANHPNEQDVHRVRDFMTQNWIELVSVLSDIDGLQDLAKVVNCPPNYTLNKLTGLAAKAAKSKGQALRQVVGKLVTYIEGDDGPETYAALLVSVLSNPGLYSLPEKLKQPILDEASETDMCCALALNPTAELLTEMVVHSTKSLSEEVWSIVDATNADLVNMLTRIVEAGEETFYDKWSYYDRRSFEDKLNSVLSARPSKEVYRLIPWASIESVDLRKTTYVGYASDKAAVREHNFTAISELLNETMGESPAKWESFSHLASTWTGNFGELLDAVRLL